MADLSIDQSTHRDSVLPRLGQVAAQVEAELCSCVDREGYLVDPEKGRISSEQYGEAFLALSLALDAATQGREPQSDLILRLLLNIEKNYGGSHLYHYDFVNFALSLLVKLHQREQWSAGPPIDTAISLLNRLRHSRTRAANWRAMRLVVAKATRRRIRFLRERSHLWLKGDRSGWIHDFRGRSFPIQYAVYTAAIFELGHGWFDLPESLRKHVSVTYDRTRQLFDWNSGFNTQGRGYQQIFGYGPWIYLSCRRHDWPVVDAAVKRLEDYGNGCTLPLVLSQSGDEVGRYDYHFSSVYRAFLSAWLRLAEYDARDPWIELSGPYGAVRNSGWQVGVARGGTKYASEVALSPHRIAFRDETVFEGVSGPDGGAHSGVRGREATRFVSCSPILLDETSSPIPLLGSRNSLAIEGKELRLEFHGLNVHIHRAIHAESDLIIRDSIRVEKTVKIRTVNIPILESALTSFSVECSDPGLRSERRIGVCGPVQIFFHEQVVEPGKPVLVESRIRSLR